MSYQKTNWQDSPSTATPLDAANLGHMEQGIANAAEKLGKAGTRSDLSFDTAANWASTNPVLGTNEVAHETDTGMVRVGDGVTHYVSLGTPLSRPLVPGAFSSLMASLRDGAAPAGLLILSDSTGYTAGKTRWPQLLPSYLQNAAPKYGVQTALWSDASGNVTTTTATGSYGAPTQNVAPPNGAHSVTFSGAQTVTADHPGYGVQVTGDLDVSAKISVPTWPPAGGTIVGRWSPASGNRMFSLVQTNTGQMELQVTSDGGTTSASLYSAAWPAQTANVPYWVRATLTANNGAGGYDVKFYNSTDGTTWTQVGTTQTTAGTMSLYNPPTYAAGGYDYEIGGRTGGSLLWTGTLYEVYVRNGIGGPNIVPRYPGSWVPFGSDAGITVNGSPPLTIVNGSMPGAGITYLGASARIPLMCPLDFDVRGVILSCSHNDTIKRGKDYLASWDSWLTNIRNQYGPNIPVAVTLQNPRTSPAGYLEAHRQRRLDLINWAAKNGCVVIDVWRAFMESSTPLTTLVDQTDGIHPSDSNGSPLWAQVVERLLT